MKGTPHKKQKNVHKEPLESLNKPEKSVGGKQSYERVACVFQGGGALSAYQVGAFRAIHEKGYRLIFFAGVSIGDDYYWDGGIYANTPLVTVLDALPEQDTLCFMVDCFSLKRPLPKTMDQLEERQKDIRYASHSRHLTKVYTSRQNLQAAIAVLGDNLTPEAKKNPEIQKLIELGNEKRFSVVHIIYNVTPYSHSFKDYNFIRSAISVRIETGYKNAHDVLTKPEWEQRSEKTLACSIYGVSESYFEQQ
jgi:NTE family protein